MQSSNIRVVLSTSLALLAFAGNSVLCRLALGADAIDAASFTNIRLLSGIAVLLIILSLTGAKKATQSRGGWLPATMLFLYAVTFSYAYISLETGTGALILFGCVQITMLGVSLLQGNRLRLTDWLGGSIAFAGLAYLLLPGKFSPSPTGFMLMALSGIAWGVYTLQGRKSQNPLRDTAFNFLRTVPFVVVLLLATHQANLSTEGIILAILSGGIASGVGYTIWYIALRDLSSVQAAVLQLLVPVIATGGGVLFAGEVITVRLVVASLLVLGGILLVIVGPVGVTT